MSDAKQLLARSIPAATLAGCMPSSNDATPIYDAASYDAEVQRQMEDYDRRTAETDRQLEAASRQSDHIERLNQRFEGQLDRRGKLLDRQERQADRFDAVLDRWEGMNLPE